MKVATFKTIQLKVKGSQQKSLLLWTHPQGYQETPNLGHQETYQILILGVLAA